MRHQYAGRIIAKWGKETDNRLILVNGYGGRKAGSQH